MSTTEILNPPPAPRPHETRARALQAATALALAVLVAGCGITPKAPPPPPPAPVVVAPVVQCDPPREAQDLAARHLLASQERLSALNTADLAQEANRAVDAAAVEATMDQALALSMTHTPGDLARSQALVDQVLHNNAPQADPWRQLARLMAYRLGEQKRAEDQVDRTNQQLRDAQRDNQRKLDQLNDKLEALKAIERSLNTRPGSVPPSAPAGASRPNS
jgi:hypothetical protein